MELSTLDRQMGDWVWCVYNGLRAGYSLPQALDILSQEAPEPARGASKNLWEALQTSVPDAQALVNWHQYIRSGQGAPLAEVLEQWKQAYPSAHIAQVAEKILEYQLTGGHLADLLEPLEAEFVRQSGSDPSFYDAMRLQVKQIGATLPGRVPNSVTSK